MCDNDVALTYSCSCIKYLKGSNSETKELTFLRCLENVYSCLRDA